MLVYKKIYQLAPLWSLESRTREAQRLAVNQLAGSRATVLWIKR
jgi:hypothetical protein